jgi:GTP cyclohydrolase I
MLNYVKEGTAPQIEKLDLTPILIDASAGSKNWTMNQHFRDTPKRVVKAWKELLCGIYSPPPKFITFDNEFENDTVHEIKDIKVVGVCAHHLLPMFCTLKVSIMFGKRLLGLSKYSRLAKWVFGRPGVQEDLIEEYANQIMELIEPKALKIEMDAVHTCMTIRGVEQKDASFHSTTYRGIWSVKEMCKTLSNDLKSLVEETSV